MIKITKKGNRLHIESDGYGEQEGCFIIGALAGKITIPADAVYEQYHCKSPVYYHGVKAYLPAQLFRAAAEGKIKGARRYQIREIQ